MIRTPLITTHRDNFLCVFYSLYFSHPQKGACETACVCVCVCETKAHLISSHLCLDYLLPQQQLLRKSIKTCFNKIRVLKCDIISKYDATKKLTLYAHLSLLTLRSHARDCRCIIRFVSMIITYTLDTYVV